MNTILFRPRTASEIVDTTFRICRTHYGALVTAMLVVSSPVLILGMFPVTAPVANLIFNLVFTIADGAAIAIVSEIYLGRSADAGTGLRAIQGRIGSLIGASILRNLAFFLGLILLIIPGLYVLVATFAIPMAIIIEGKSASESFSRSTQLAKSNFWHVVRTMLLLGAIFLGLFFGLIILITIVAEMVGIAERFVEVITNVALVLVYPLFSVGGTLLYYDLRIRSEGFDLEMMLRNLGEEGVTGAAGHDPMAPSIS